MTYFWYLIFNRSEFEALGLVSKTYSLELEAIGEVEVLVTKGNLISMLYEGIFLPVKINGLNPYEIDDHASFEDAEGNIYLGIKADET